MKPVYVEDDVYEHIARLTMESGHSPSVNLRRALGIGAGAMLRDSTVKGSTQSVVSDSAGKVELNAGHELSNVLSEPLFRTSSNAVDRMLRVFEEVHDQRGADFGKVLSIQGRHRKYFARSRDEIEASGRSTQPRQIPGTTYWVMTNSPTPQKQDMVREVLALLDFSKAAVDASAAVIV